MLIFHIVAIAEAKFDTIMLGIKDFELFVRSLIFLLSCPDRKPKKAHHWVIFFLLYERLTLSMNIIIVCTVRKYLSYRFVD